MGCGTSRVEESKLVVMCRERRDLIRHAVDQRYALASSHAAYFRSLQGIGNALQRFVEEELVVISSSSTSGSSSPVLTIPSSEGKGGSRSRSLVGGTGGGGAGGSTPRSSISHSHFHEEGDDSHLHLSSEDSHLHFSSGEEEEGEGEGEGESSGGKGAGIYYSYSPPPGFSGAGNSEFYHNMSYMKHSSGIPSTLYQNPYPSFGGFEYGYPHYGGGNEGGGHVGVSGSTSFTPSDVWSSYYNNYYYDERPAGYPQRLDRPPTPPPPPPAGGSGWEFLDPFGTYEPAYARYKVDSFGSSPDSSEVREKEGIPDLEDETEQEVVKDTGKRKMDVGVSGQKDSEMDSGSKASLSRDKLKKNVMENPSNEKQSIGSPECIASTGSSEGSMLKECVEDDELVRKRGVTFEVDTSLDAEISEPSIAVALSNQGTKDIREAVKKIKDQFIAASHSGEDLSTMLEVGKLHYRSQRTAIGVISSRILHSLPMLACMQPFYSLKHSKLSAARMSKSSHQYDRRSTTTLNGFSSILEKLYVWEKKLYKEVKDEEKLRITYEKAYKKLKGLDDTGAESYKIEEIRVSIRTLETKIDITIKSIDAISRRIQKLRDEELRPHLTKLIHSWVKMWKSLLDCHRKQYETIVGTKTRNIIAKSGEQGISVAKTSKQLELELRNWSLCFSDWISRQKTYLETLNGWLFRSLDVKPEVTPDGEVPFSPGRIEAPAVFILCNDWCQALNRISEAEVTNNMIGFVESVHKLGETQAQERRQWLKTEYCSQDFSRRQRSWQKDRAKHLHTEIQITVLPENEGPLDDQLVALDSARKRWEEEKAKHDLLMKQVHEAASGSLRGGLVPIFEALSSFTSEMLKAYDGIRIPGPDGRT